MFKISDLKWGRWIVPAACSVSLAGLLVGCTHPPSDPGEMETRVIENFAGKTPVELYADLIGPGVFEQSASYDSDGYQVVSGNLRMKDNSMGYLIDVRSPDGSHFAFVGGPGKDGVVKLTKNGERTFVPSPPDDDEPLRDDVVEGGEEGEVKFSTSPEDKTVSPRAPVVIDVLAVYARSAVNSLVVDRDLNADARARLETVNLSLRNARINDISLRLAKTVIHEESLKVTGGTLGQMRGLFGKAAKDNGADLIALFVETDSYVCCGYPRGKAFMPGRISISSVARRWIFPHEIGHNVGGLHCAGDRRGYANGYMKSAQCLDKQMYYSGLIGWEPGDPVQGNWADADMARKWTEQKYRMASYEPPYPPKPQFQELAPENFKGIPGKGSIQFSWAPIPDAVEYKIIKTLGLPPVVATSVNPNFLLEGRQATTGRYSVEGVDAKGTLSKRSVYLEIVVPK
ncbi:hypothetical protein IMF27_21375 [Pseudomonas sp. PCH199]|uniref:hypothetical protein n=1 Tax=unclassified Pseudomonas TaxID=196821 RepID=UPI000BC7D56D|nr:MULTISPECIES: hypothetical protein [unclassified Pseudomonas]MCW8277823.1 hypothetical protein [Pseudomonas sp. PCH199]PAM81984.1 hypothetical protein CES87_21795 [Pseudomonas sp. ERMR1:02]